MNNPEKKIELYKKTRILQLIASKDITYIYIPTHEIIVGDIDYRLPFPNSNRPTRQIKINCLGKTTFYFPLI